MRILFFALHPSLLSSIHPSSIAIAPKKTPRKQSYKDRITANPSYCNSDGSTVTDLYTGYGKCFRDPILCPNASAFVYTPTKIHSTISPWSKKIRSASISCYSYSNPPIPRRPWGKTYRLNVISESRPRRLAGTR